MARRAGVISIDIQTGSAQAILDLDRISGKLREVSAAGHSSVSGVQATSGALRVLEGNMTNNLRASERFIANVLHLGPALQAAFPVVGAIAFAGILGELGKKVHNFFREMNDAPNRIGNAFRELNAPIRVANDELLVTRDRLANDIAKLEGKPVNGIALALDQARLASDKLAESLENDIKKLDELMEKKNSVGWWTGLIGHLATTGSDEDESKSFSKRIRNIQDSGTANEAAAKTPQDAKSAREATNAAILAALDAQIARQKELLALAVKLQATYEHQRLHGVPMATVGGAADQDVSVRDQSGVLAERSGYLRNLESIRSKYATSGEVANLEQKKGGLEAGAEAARKYREELKRLQDELMLATEAQLTGLQKVAEEERNETIRLQEAKQLNTVTAALVGKIYDAKRVAVYTELTTKLNGELYEASKRWETLSVESHKALGEFFGKEIESGTKMLDEHSKAITKLAEQYSKLTEASGSQSLQHKVGMVTAGGDHGNPLGALAQQQMLQRQDIEDRYQNSLKLASQTLHGDELMLQKQNLDKERGIELTKLQNDMELKAAEVRQKGINDFFLDMQGQARTAGDIFYESMHSALDQVSDQFAKLITRQKTGFAQMFKSEGETMLKESIKSGLQRGLGAISKHFGLGSKADGSAGNPFHVIVDGAGIGTGGAAKAASSGLSTVGGIASKAAGGIGGFFKGLLSGGIGPTDSLTGLPALAGGGDVSPGGAYWVGEDGPEPFIPSSAGTVVSRKDLGGDTHYHNYSIDARGADLGAAQRMARALEQVHNSAVATSVQAAAEHRKRSPGGR